MKLSAELQLQGSTSLITGFTFFVEKWLRTCSVKFFIKLSLYSFVLVLRVVEISFIRLPISIPILSSVLTPERVP